MPIRFLKACWNYFSLKRTWNNFTILSVSCNPTSANRIAHFAQEPPLCPSLQHFLSLPFHVLSVKNVILILKQTETSWEMKVLYAEDLNLSEQFCPQQNSKLFYSIKIFNISTKYPQRASACSGAPELWGSETSRSYHWIPARGTRKTTCLES